MGLVALQLVEAVACVLLGLRVLRRRAHAALTCLRLDRAGPGPWVPHLLLLRLQRRLQNVSELTQLLPLAIMSLFDLINTSDVS